MCLSEKRRKIESLSAQDLADELVNNGYSYSYEAVIEKNINGKYLLEMSSSSKIELRHFMSSMDLQKFWSFVLRVQCNPQNFKFDVKKVDALQKVEQIPVRQLRLLFENSDQNLPVNEKSSKVLMEDKVQMKRRNYNISSYPSNLKSNSAIVSSSNVKQLKTVTTIPILNISSLDGVARLEGTRIGDFLIRINNTHNFDLMVKVDIDEVLNVPLRIKNGCARIHTMHTKKSRQFRNLSELISFYKENNLELFAVHGRLTLNKMLT